MSVFCLGVVEVSYEEDSSGGCNLVARPCEVTSISEHLGDSSDEVMRNEDASPSTSVTNKSDTECIVSPVVFSPRQR